MTNETAKQTRKRILIVEDDRALETILDRVIHQVSPRSKTEWVSSGEEALFKIKNQVAQKSAGYDLIVADIFLEGKITGLEFWNAVQVLCPETTILIMSSMPVDCFFKSIGPKTISPPFLPKPFSIGECRQILTSLLREQGQVAA